MKLTALRLHNVRRFAGHGIAIEGIGDGVNVLSAVNEFGKSTCFDALHALFFQPHTGTPRDVKALQPYSGGSPLVEADIATPDGPFRLTKQFYAGRRAMVRDLASGRLVAQADEAERFIAALVQGGTSGPAGLLWVRQGMTGIERRAKSDDDSEKRARESVLTSVQGEVEALTGGRRMAQAIAACEAELSPLVTAGGKPKTGGPYAGALNERDRLVAIERGLAGDVEALRDALNTRRVLRGRLAELEDAEQISARQDDLRQAEAAFASARTQADALRAADLELALARNRANAARLALDTYQSSLARFAALGDIAAADGARRDEALTRQRAAAAGSQAADIAVDRAESDERAARDLMTRLEKALAARAAAEKLAALRQAYASAEAGRAEIESIAAQRKAKVLPVEALRQLEALEIELAGLRAGVAARAPVMRVDYHEGASGSVRIDGVACLDGEERTLSRSATLVIADVGTVTLTLPQEQAGHAALVQAEAKRDALLATLGVESLAQAREFEAMERELAVRLGLATQSLTLLAPDGLPALREGIARLETQNEGAIDIRTDPDATRLALAAAETRVTASRNAVREAKPLHEAADLAVISAEKALATVAADIAGLAVLLGPEAGRATRRAALLQAAEAADQALMSAQTKVESLRAGATELSGAQARVQRMQSVITARDTETANLREQMADLNGQIRARAEAAVEEAWQEAIERRMAADTRVAALEREIALLTRLRAALDTARAAARDHYFEPVMGELRPLLGLLFEDATVLFDEETLLPRSVIRKGQEEPIGVLSGGMREQMAVLTRLAFARLLAKDGQPAPVILDDALVYSDDDRIERMFDALHRQASSQQIIVFSCRQRAFAQLGGQVLRMVPWTPAV